MQSGETGKVVVITGATGGIGEAVARALSGAGYSLVLSAPSAEKLAALASQLGGPCTVVAANLSDDTIPETLLYAAIDRFGRCDACVNNGGLLEAGLIETIDIERLCNMVRVNVEGAFRVAYVFLKHFVEEGQGHLVNVSGGVGKNVRPTVYGATQRSIELLSEALSAELAGTDVHVSCIQPGLVKSGLHDRWVVFQENQTTVADTLEPADVARMVLFILKKTADERVPGAADSSSVNQI
jgi:serine 3-dehydrogenase